MKEYLKNEIKHIPMMLLLLVLFYGIVAFATGNYLFNSSDVEYDNTNSGIQSTNVADAIDELYACASNYSTYNNRLTGVENNKSDKSSTVSTVNWDTTNNKLTKTINGTTSDIVTGSTILNGLTKSQVTTALGYTPPTTDTNTWRPVQNNLTSTSTTDCLSAAQGKALNGKSIDSSGDGFVKFADGTMIQWGAESTASASNRQITMGKSFKNTTSFVVSCSEIGGMYYNNYAISNDAANKFTIYVNGVQTTVKFSWIAIGRWK